jgi:hypothetical protein
MAFPWLALAIGASTAVSYMGSIQTSKQLKAGAAWDKYYKDIEKKQNIIAANKQATKLLSAKRASFGARGVAMGTGSSLFDQEQVVANLEDTLFWIEKGVEMDIAMIDVKLAGKLSEESWNRKTSLLKGLGQTYSASKTT